MKLLRRSIVGDAQGIAIVSDRCDLDRSTLAHGGVSDRIGPLMRVALCVDDPLRLVNMLCRLDGEVAAILLLSASQTADTVDALCAAAGIDLLIADREDDFATPRIAPATAAGGWRAALPVATEWLMTTSGTTGLPKIVPHRLDGLTRTVYRFQDGRDPRWGLLYDPTRFAGMQVVLQALLGGGALITPSPHASLGDRLAELARHGCTHLSATPTLWRRILMLPQGRDLPLEQITLGGETADQDILDALAKAWPQAKRTHIYASTEAGVGFAVKDGLAGFPLSFLTDAPGGVGLKITDDVLWLRPPGDPRPAQTGPVTIDEDGYVLSGDLIRVEGDRAHFLGRETGAINVGGAKVYPETVERAIMQVPGVHLVKVGAKSSPITGALVMAEIMPDPGTDPAALKAAVQQHCRDALPREAMPGMIRIVDDLEINSAGKLVRRAKSLAKEG